MAFSVAKDVGEGFPPIKENALH